MAGKRPGKKALLHSDYAALLADVKSRWPIPWFHHLTLMEKVKGQFLGLFGVPP